VNFLSVVGDPRLFMDTAADLRFCVGRQRQRMVRTECLGDYMGTGGRSPRMAWQRSALSRTGSEPPSPLVRRRTRGAGGPHPTRPAAAGWGGLWEAWGSEDGDASLAQRSSRRCPALGSRTSAVTTWWGALGRVLRKPGCPLGGTSVQQHGRVRLDLGGEQWHEVEPGPRQSRKCPV
jgi:hypothetical protein